MARRDLEFIAERARLGYFPVGSTIVEPASGIAEYLHIIQRGHVRVRNPNAAVDDEVRGVGECFPVAALAAGATGTRTFEATEDVFSLLLPRADFDALRERSPEFAQFCTEALATLVQHSLGQLRNHFSQRATDQQTMLEPLKALVRREPVYCTAETTVRAALERMSEEGVRTIAVVDSRRRPLGIFTLLDLMERVVLPGMSLATPVQQVMTTGPAMLDELSNAQEGLALMASRGFHQLLVVRDGELAGIVTERDLFGLQRVTMRNITQSVRQARDVAGLQRIVADIAALTDNLVAQGAAAEPLTHTITALNDSLAQRLFELLLPGIPARRRGMVLARGRQRRPPRADGRDRPGQRDRLRVRTSATCRSRASGCCGLPLQRTERLAELGFPLCSGNIMASNPDCCLTDRRVARALRRLDARADAGGAAGGQYLLRFSSADRRSRAGRAAARLARCHQRREQAVPAHARGERAAGRAAARLDPHVPHGRRRVRGHDRSQDPRHADLRRCGASVRAGARHRRHQYVAADPHSGPSVEPRRARDCGVRRCLPFPAVAAPARAAGWSRRHGDRAGTVARSARGRR